MQPRLMRSRTEVIIAGVCGGLAEYFAIDPVIVRLIFVLVTLTSGLGLLIYPILWLVMPKAGAAGNAELFPQNAEEWRRRAEIFSQEASQVSQELSREVREVLRQGAATGSQGRTATPPAYGDVPPPEAYRYDPITGQPLNPTTGQTVNLRLDPTEANLAAPSPYAQQGAPAPATPRRRGRFFGFVLLAFGVLLLANVLNIGEYVFPLLLIGGGFMLLRKR